MILLSFFIFYHLRENNVEVVENETCSNNFITSLKSLSENQIYCKSVTHRHSNIHRRCSKSLNWKFTQSCVPHLPLFNHPKHLLSSLLNCVWHAREFSLSLISEIAQIVHSTTIHLKLFTFAASHRVLLISKTFLMFTWALCSITRYICQLYILDYNAISIVHRDVWKFTCDFLRTPPENVIYVFTLQVAVEN